MKIFLLIKSCAQSAAAGEAPNASLQRNRTPSFQRVPGIGN